jgi:phenylalanyl-tRNA synthetase alpha chain
VTHPRVDALAGEARGAVEAAGSSADLEALRVRYLGRQGAITQLLRSLGTLPPEERPVVGAAANEAKRELEALLDARLSEALAREKSAQRARDRLDLTLPGRRPPLGVVHPLTRVHDEIVSIFGGLGFSVAEGPEIETDFYNFEALNIPKDHPARDMQDTFYLSDDTLLRTHTSPVQIRSMQGRQPPIRIIAPGKVYRSDSDQTHSPMFHQIEGLLVDETSSFADLKGTITEFLRAFFERDLEMMFKPTYFPFVEPGADVIIRWQQDDGSSTWLEVLGCGMVHPNVLSNVGIDPERYTGFAFGMGVERLAMLRYGVRDLRAFFENDLRFLRQFA